MPDYTLAERVRMIAFGMGDREPELADTLREAADELERLEREARPLHSIGAELAVDAGVPVPMPQPRRFAVWLADGWDRPSPGAFVFAGPALAVWRVVGVEEVPRGVAQAITVHEDADGSERWPVHVLLEAVDSHDVPTTARVAEVPLPVVEVPDDVSTGAAA